MKATITYKTGLLHGDISTGDFILDEEERNPSWPAFLIDLDLAIQEPSKATGSKTGTRALMATGLLLSEQHAPRHDSWVLFICVHSKWTR